MAIKFEKVSYEYYGADGTPFKALENIDLEISDQGEFISLIGETGSGKSTLVQHMNALIKPTSGDVTIYGIKVDNEYKKKRKKIKLNPLRKKVGLVFQFPEYQLFEETVEKDIAFGPKNFGLDEQQALIKAREALKLVGLKEDYLKRSPFNLSGGEKKRVSIAGILAMEPDILVLDEPTSGLDPKGRDDLLELFLSLRKRYNKTIIIITHDMNIVYQYASRVLVMNDGKLVFDGKPIDLFTMEHIDKWNLDKPEIISITDEIKSKFGFDIKEYPKTIEELFSVIKGEL
jgi:energy-coupling factor transport system ATP-binding protein